MKSDFCFAKKKVRRVGNSLPTNYKTAAWAQSAHPTELFLIVQTGGPGE